MNYSYIALGVKSDCRNLLKKFAATKSVRFEEFVKIWRDMQFPCIYCGRESFAELYEFIEEVSLCKKGKVAPLPNQVPHHESMMTA